MLAYMRNVRTTEHRAVEHDSEEFYKLRAEIDGNGKPVWEQTSYPDATEQRQRLDEGRPRDEDLGHDEQPTERIIGRPPAIQTPEQTGANESLTPGEVESDVTEEDKEEEARGSSAYSDQTVSELKDELASRDLAVSGNKEELVRRLDEDDSGSESSTVSGDDEDES